MANFAVPLHSSSYYSWTGSSDRNDGNWENSDQTFCSVIETESPDDKGKHIEFSCLEADARRVQLPQNILRFSSYNHDLPKHKQPLA